MKKNLTEHDVVVLKVTLGKMPVGSIGTVIHVYKESGIYEIEFILKDGSSTTLGTKNPNEVLKI